MLHDSDLSMIRTYWGEWCDLIVVV